MSSVLFWTLVLVLSVIVGAILPKIVGMLFRMVLYFIAFFLVLWVFYRAGLVPDTWSKRVNRVFIEVQKKSGSVQEAKKMAIPCSFIWSGVIFFRF